MQNSVADSDQELIGSANPLTVFKKTKEPQKRSKQFQIRIHMFLGLPYPDLDPLVRGMDPDTEPSIGKQI
jgi:hypothetical protein